MRELYKIFYVVVLLVGVSLTGFAAKKITIHTMPENATIMIDGAEVGNGNYTVKFERKVDFYIVKVSAPGYLTKSFKLLKSNPNNSVLYKLSPDEAMQSSRGGEDAGRIWLTDGLTSSVVKVSRKMKSGNVLSKHPSTILITSK